MVDEPGASRMLPPVTKGKNGSYSLDFLVPKTALDKNQDPSVYMPQVFGEDLARRIISALSNNGFSLGSVKDFVGGMPTMLPEVRGDGQWSLRRSIEAAIIDALRKKAKPIPIYGTPEGMRDHPSSHKAEAIRRNFGEPIVDQSSYGDVSEFERMLDEREYLRRKLGINL